MSNPTYIACPRCGEPLAMSSMQKRLYHGRTLTCQRCAKPFAITEETPDPAPMRPPAAPSIENEPAPTQPNVSPRTPMRPASIALLVAAGIVLFALVLAMVIGPSIERSRERARREACEQNFVEISSALQVYAASNGGQFPDSLDALIADGSIAEDVLVCPSTGHPNYVYLGKGLSVNGPATQVLLYEPLGNHGGAGANVIYLDGTTQFLPANAAPQATSQPVNTPTSQPVPH